MDNDAFTKTQKLVCFKYKYKFIIEAIEIP